jgi:hypothetical protein
MNKLIPSILLSLLVSFNLSAQKSKKGFEYTGSKVRFSMLGKSRMFSEGVKSMDYTIYWNKKKNIVSVNAGSKDLWYEIQLSQVDTIHGHVTHLGSLKNSDKGASPEEKEKAKCEVRFLMDKITVKKGPARLEEYLLEGATVWDDNKVVSN